MKNILFLTQEAFDFFYDCVYHGFAKLPDITCWDYPLKATYHGGKIQDKATNFRFDFPMPVFHIEGVEKELKDGKYDFVVASTRCDPRWIGIAKQYTTVVLLDGEDNKELKDELVDKCHIIFKREYYKELHSSVEKVVPLSFGYIDYDPPSNVEKDLAISFVCCLTHPLRAMIHEQLRSLGVKEVLSEVNSHPNSPMSYSRYMDTLDRSEVAISLPGQGMDTYRYWQIPGRGACLFALNLPIVIENNFQHQKEAVFSDTLGELWEHLIYYMNHMNETRQIAAAGKKLVYEKHLSTHRAQRVLEVVEDYKKKL